MTGFYNTVFTDPRKIRRDVAPGLYDSIFADPRKIRIAAEEAQRKSAQETNARLDTQEADALATSRSQQETINARRRAMFGRSGRRLLLSGDETGVAAAQLKSTLGG